MSMLQPAPPPFDLAEWRAKPYLARLKANCQDWAVNGFGPPEVVFLLYAIKLVMYVAGAAAVISLTPGLGGWAISAIGGPSRSSTRSSPCGRCSGRSSGWGPGRCS